MQPVTPINILLNWLVIEPNEVLFNAGNDNDVKFVQDWKHLLKIVAAAIKFNALNTTVLFDLPATYTLTGADSVTYTRNPKYDTATALAWKVGAYGTTNFTPAYYTSGTTDPVVSDTIYSDAACTTAVTTISAIA